MGFEHILQLDECYVPRIFAQWIADNTRPEAGVIKIGEDSIPINPKSFEDVLGIPAGKLPRPEALLSFFFAPPPVASCLQLWIYKRFLLT